MRLVLYVDESSPSDDDLFPLDEDDGYCLTWGLSVACVAVGALVVVLLAVAIARSGT